MKRSVVFLFTLVFSVVVYGLAGIDLNTASMAELENLPGVGKKLAAEIVSARPFKSVDDLKNVKGIGAAKFAKLQGLVQVGAAAATAPSVPATNPVTTANAAANAPAAVKETTTTAIRGNNRLAPGTKINLNTASVDDLEKLPGIGKKKAAAIVSARPFSAPEDLMKVKGIKAGVFAKIKDYVTVN